MMNEPSLAFNITREQGANVIKTMADVREVVKELAEGPVKRENLLIEQVYDETDYINSSIDLVRQNIIYGGILAIIVLMIFLRSWRPTAVVAVAIPVSVVGSFVAMAVLGRSLNVISLAGIAFAVGMVVDAAIVVLENIFRLRQEGRSRSESAYYGAQQVWPAVLVSALTTVMVFIPILIMDFGSWPIVPRHRGGDFGLGPAVAAGRRDADSGFVERATCKCEIGKGRHSGAVGRRFRPHLHEFLDRLCPLRRPLQNHRGRLWLPLSW